MFKNIFRILYLVNLVVFVVITVGYMIGTASPTSMLIVIGETILFAIWSVENSIEDALKSRHDRLDMDVVVSNNEITDISARMNGKPMGGGKAGVMEDDTSKMN